MIHAVGPIWRDGQSGEEDILYDSVHNSLREASKRQLKSIAIPAVSTGVFGFPVEKATRTIVEAIKEFWHDKSESKSSLREVILIDITGRTVNTFHEALCSIFGADLVRRKAPRVQDVSDMVGRSGRREAQDKGTGESFFCHLTTGYNTRTVIKGL